MTQNNDEDSFLRASPRDREDEGGQGADNRVTDLGALRAETRETYLAQEYGDGKSRDNCLRIMLLKQNRNLHIVVAVTGLTRRQSNSTTLGNAGYS